MTDRELMQQALDALEGYARNCRCEGGGAPCDAAEALRARLAQPDLSQVGEVGVWGERQWQGLTDEEMQLVAFSRAIEAKLKERNT